MPLRPSLLLVLIVLAYLVIGTLYAIKTPAWQVPDEPAQYNYVAQVYKNGCCPKMEPGDWDNDYLEAIKAARFAPSMLERLSTIQYEDHQPPLYYLLVLPVYAISEGSLTALRLASVLIGAGVVILAWAAVQTVFPAQPWLALATAAFVAFLPQHVFMMAGVENDSLAELIVALVLFLGVLYLGGRRQIHPLILGLLMGAAFITKLTVYLPVVGVLGLAVLLRARRECWPMGRLARQSAWILVPALLIGGVWWTRNIITYGSVADFMVQKTHDAVVVGQERTDDYQAQHGGVGGWLRDGVSITFHSFWGQFGWMGVPMPDSFYTGLLAFTVFVIVGALIAAIRWRGALNVIQREQLLLLGTAAFLAFAAFAGYNFKFVQFQGRYLYPGLIPIGLFVAAGLAGWAPLVAPRSPVARWLTVGIVCLLALLDVYALYRFILPMLA
jgi:hypothetical protein